MGGLSVCGPAERSQKRLFGHPQFGGDGGKVRRTLSGITQCTLQSFLGHAQLSRSRGQIRRADCVALSAVVSPALHLRRRSRHFAAGIRLNHG